MSETVETIQMDMRKLAIPADWLANSDSKVLMTAYRIINYGDFLPTQSEIVSEFKHIRSILCFGTISYPIFIEDWAYGEKDRTIFIQVKEEKKTRNGAWIIFAQPFEDSRVAEIKRDLSSYCAVYLSLLGRPMLFHEEYQHILHATGKTTIAGEIKLNPSSLHDLNLNGEKLQSVGSVLNKLDALENVTRERIMLSLHWFEKGIRTEGVDAFLYLWIAIESLAMPDTTNIKPLKEALKRIYKSNSATGSTNDDRFLIGRIFGLRGKIVHDGVTINIRFELLEYLQAIFTDILLDKIGSAPVFKLNGIINQQKISINDLVPSA